MPPGSGFWGEIQVLVRHIAKAYHDPWFTGDALLVQASALEKYMIASAVLKDDYLRKTLG